MQVRDSGSPENDKACFRPIGVQSGEKGIGASHDAAGPSTTHSVRYIIQHDKKKHPAPYGKSE